MKDIKFPIGSGVGKIKYRTDAREEYINHAVQSVNADLSNLKIVVDCAEGAAYYTSVEALKELGAEIIAIHNNPDGSNINANRGSTHMEELMARVVYEKANIGLALTGMQTDFWQWMKIWQSGGRRPDYGHCRDAYERAGKLKKIPL